MNEKSNSVIRDFTTLFSVKLQEGIVNGDFRQVENQRLFMRVLSELRKASHIPNAYVDLFDPRPLNQQVLEASGFKERYGNMSHINGTSLDDSLQTEEAFTFNNGRTMIRLRTIGDFRRFCSLPGIEIEVVVPEDYKPC